MDEINGLFIGGYEAFWGQDAKSVVPRKNTFL